MECGLTNAVLFSPQGKVIQPSDSLHKKHVLIQRGSFRPFTNLHQDMLLKGRELFCNEKDGGCSVSDTIVVMEMTTKNLMDNVVKQGVIDNEDFLDRVEMLNALNYHVLISEYFEYFRLRDYINRYTQESVGILMGAIHLEELFNPEHYADLKGGILEAFGLLFSGKMKLYIYPAKNKDGSLITVKSFEPKSEVRGLYEMLLQNKRLIDMKGVSDKYLHILSRDLARKIQGKDPSWKKDVPEEVFEILKSRKLFGYKGD
jgi:hypothetical protein